MKAEPIYGIEPLVLQWARQTIGLSVDEVAARLKRPVDEIRAWESGSSGPTYSQLEKLAYHIYKRPLAVFFLPSPPEEIIPAREFRSLPYTDLQQLLPDTHLQIRRGHAYQLSLVELFDGDNPVREKIWETLRLNIEGIISEQAQVIRTKLGVSFREQTLWKDDDLALKEWRKAIEAVGIFVFKAPFKQDDISGFCLFNQNFPLIYLNNTTTKTRQIFSLLHELSHILLSVNGISKFEKSYFSELPLAERAIEKFCNALSAEILIPTEDFNDYTKMFTNVEYLAESEFSNLAKRYGVSREAVLRRFLDQGRVSQSFYQQKSKFWARQHRSGSGGNWYASQKTYLSERYANEVVSRYYRNQISVEQAADFLGIRAKNFLGLEQAILQGGAA